MERTDIEKTDELLKNLKTDKNATKELFTLFGSRMLKEAKLYISDKEETKKICIQAFRNSFSKLKTAEAEDVENILVSAVQNECIRQTVFEESTTKYTSDDEVPSAHAAVPKDTNKILSSLKSLLNRLTPSQRIIAVLKYRDGMSFEAIAKKLNISEANIKGIFQDAKNTVKASISDSGIVFAFVNKVYPFYEDKKEQPVLTLEKQRGRPVADPLSEEDQFNTSVDELREFFNTKPISTKAISDAGIDDTDENQYVSDQFGMDKSGGNDSTKINDTASSAKVIMAVAMSAEDDKKKHGDKYNPVSYWVKRIAIILVLLIIGFAISVGVMTMRAKKNTPANTSELEASEVAEP